MLAQSQQVEPKKISLTEQGSGCEAEKGLLSPLSSFLKSFITATASLTWSDNCLAN
jgi:hypothetical protein